MSDINYSTEQLEEFLEGDLEVEERVDLEYQLLVLTGMPEHKVERIAHRRRIELYEEEAAMSRAEEAEALSALRAEIISGQVPEVPDWIRHEAYELAEEIGSEYTQKLDNLSLEDDPKYAQVYLDIIASASAVQGQLGDISV